MKTTDPLLVITCLEFNYSVKAILKGKIHAYHVQEYCEDSFQLFNKSLGIKWADTKQIDYFTIPGPNHKSDNLAKPTKY